MELYDARTVAAQFSIPYCTIISWIETGLVQSHVDSGSSKKRRTPVLLSNEDVEEIRRLAQLRRYLRGQSLRDVFNTLREMGPNPLSQGDFFVLENRKGQRNTIRILQNNEAIQLLHSQPDRQLRLIPLTGEAFQWPPVQAENQLDLPSASSEESTALGHTPISLLFDLDQFTPVEIAEIIGLLSEIYHDVGGDALIIEDLTLLDPTSIMAEV